MHRNRTVAGLSLGLFVLGAVLHLGVLDYHAGRTIFGDNGDGFFNLWVMDHVAGNAARGDFSPADGRIFWPDNSGTYWWSDNLIVPSLAFGLFRTWARNVFEAFWLTGFLMALLGFVAYLVLFGVVFRTVRRCRPELPDWSVLLVPLFAYMACFSRARLLYFSHFQNLSSLWLFPLVAGMIGHALSGRRGYFALVVVSELILLYSAPYYAVTGMSLIFLWALFLLFCGYRELLRVLRENWLVLVACAPLFLFLAAIYAVADHFTYTPLVVRSFSIGFRHLIMPDGGPLAGVAGAVIHAEPPPDGERPAYVGVGLAIAVLAVLIRHVPTIVSGVRSEARRLVFWALLVSVAAWVGVCAYPGPVTAWLGLALVAVILLLGLRYLALLRPVAPLAFAGAFLALASFVTYGIAFGPSVSFLDQPASPCVWGLFSWVVPGFASMRAVGRLAVVGQGFLIAALALYVIASFAVRKGRVALLACALILMAVQFAEQIEAKAEVGDYDAENVTPTSEEALFFAQLRGPLVEFPAIPFYGSAMPMLYFNRFPGICLMNGYSSHSTATWDQVMRLEADSEEAGENPIRFAEEKGVRYIVIDKGRAPRGRVEALRKGDRRVLFENDRFLVLLRRGGGS